MGRAEMSPRRRTGYQQRVTDDDAIVRLLRRLQGQAGAQLPTTTLGRLRRTATSAARLGVGVVAGKLRGDDEIDEEAIGALVMGFGELKGVAMKMGQILSYVDTTLTPAARQ